MIELPEKIKKLIGEKNYTIDQIGKSDSTVIVFDNMILKIQTITEESDNEHEMMLWLQDKLPVPKVLAFERKAGLSYLLMSKVEGKMSCDEEYINNPNQLATLLTKGLRGLWQVDIANCPTSFALDRKLQMAQYNVEQNFVDLEDAEPDTYGEHGFRDPSHLLQWLIDNKPEEELVLSHGDFCLPNLFGRKEEVTGYIDLGKTGIADRWQDIALCYRSLLHNYDGTYTGKAYEGFDRNLLFEYLGIEPQWDKIRYYILLDELF
ncbi:APH(3') family aminoglycoside O-phosphotransferase [Anaerosporobacter faecicola]|uniref:APH(3') family aminoglycoside O-phosphotransferase n=1 Tax=Anaerosporobacter faecicola TaxID=2718714 RepID=UPI001439C895|nr:APH(3') family aminoglycoside O-phosphotransferase [Anaerosporobacter faecicola]